MPEATGDAVPPIRAPGAHRIDSRYRRAYPLAPGRLDRVQSVTSPGDFPMTDLEKHKRMANAIRALAMDAVQKAKSGHPGMPMGMADVATVLFSKYLKFDPADPAWPDRDRFVLSAGHGSMLLYALLYLTGYPEMTIEELQHFRQLHSKTPGHPENFMTKGIETTTGPLGQGVATSVGMALAERMLAAEFGADIVDHKTFVICSDGDLMEGISHEAIALAGHLKLNRLIFLFDDNGISIDGPLTLADSVDQVARFKAAGWNAMRIDGHDPMAITGAIDQAQKSDRPTLIACKTTIGFGAPTKQGTAKAHGEPLGDEEIAGARKNLGWDSPPFVIPGDILNDWRAAGSRGAGPHADWKKRFAALDAGKRAEFERRFARKRPAALAKAFADLKAKIAADKPTLATRKASELALEAITVAMPELILGSADLTPSNNTKTKNLTDIKPGDYAGRYIHYGIREHGMAAAMNGMAVHGGYQPAGATFLVFTDYARPAMRIAALAHIPVVYVMTHDSIGLGEDGPTHQPVEHIAALRCMPNMRVFRPADTMETAECWQLALERTDGPSVLALTRQNLKPARMTADAEQPLRQGRLRDFAGRGQGDGDDLRLGFRGGAGDRGAGPPEGEGHRRPRRFGTLAGPVPAAGRGRARRRHRRYADQGRGRGGGPLRLGCDHRPRRDFRRHALLRRERAL